MQLTWSARDAAGNPVAGATVSFQSDRPAVATVNAAGQVTGVTTGTVTITAASGSATGTFAMSVVPGGLVTTAGAVLSGFNGAVELTVPAGALAAPTPVRLSPGANPLLDPTVATGTVYSVGPGNLTFAVPATLRMSYSAANGPLGLPAQDFRIRVYDGAAWAGIPGGTADAASGRATASLTTTGLFSVGWAAPTAACTSPESRQFDFWLGSWAVSSGGPPFAQSDITAVPGGCAILEHYRDNGGTVGRSINFFEPASGMWYQTYVDNGGGRLTLRGTLRGGAMELYFPSAASTQHQLWRWTIEGANVRQVASTSGNGGASYNGPFFNGLYTPR